MPFSRLLQPLNLTAYALSPSITILFAFKTITRTKGLTSNASLSRFCRTVLCSQARLPITTERCGALQRHLDSTVRIQLSAVAAAAAAAAAKPLQSCDKFRCKFVRQRAGADNRRDAADVDRTPAGRIATDEPTETI